MNLHHAGVLVRDIPEAAARYLELGYQLRTEVIHDPLQTAYVQFLKLPGDTAYLELVAPDGPDSKLGNALRKGVGLHHLCYTVVDIEDACGRLSSAGWFLVSPPLPAAAFPGRRIAWLRGADRLLMELLERGAEGEL